MSELKLNIRVEKSMGRLWDAFLGKEVDDRPPYMVGTINPSYISDDTRLVATETKDGILVVMKKYTGLENPENGKDLSEGFLSEESKEIILQTRNGISTLKAIITLTNL